MREIEMRSVVDGEGDTEFQLPSDELAEALGVSEDELVDTIRSDEVEYREVGADDGGLVVEIEVLVQRFRLKIMSQQ